MISGQGIGFGNVKSCTYWIILFLTMIFFNLRLKNGKISKNVNFQYPKLHTSLCPGQIGLPPSPLRQPRGQRKNVCDKKGRVLQTEVKKGRALENELFKVIN